MSSLSKELTKAGLDPFSIKPELGQSKALRRLGYRHKLIIVLHLQGKLGTEIAKLVGCSTGRVYGVLNDPSSQIIIKHFNEGFDHDLKALYPKVIQQLSKALDDDDRALNAIDRFIKMTGRDRDERDKGGININVQSGARVKLVQELRGAVERNPTAIEIVPEQFNTDD